MELLSLPTQFGLVTMGFDESAVGRDAKGRKTSGGLCWLRIGEPLSGRAANQPSSAAKSVLSAIASWAGGDVSAIDAVGVVESESDFTNEIRAAMRRIKPGRPLSYSELAAAGGRPSAVRAAASVCARNPVPIVVPCHRVVRSGGAVGNYFYGADMKIAMLQLEGWRG